MVPGSFALIGAGQVASHLAPAFVSGGIPCDAVWSRTIAHAQKLSERLAGTLPLDDLKDFVRQILSRNTELILISVPDNAIPEVVSALPNDLCCPVVHTSGTTSMEVLGRFSLHGVLYPMQTFSHSRDIDLTEVPFFLEFNDPKVEDLLKALTESIGAKKVYRLPDEDRVKLHLAAVFGCNFVNHLYALSSHILESTSIPFEVLRPLLAETLDKAMSQPPEKVQTGPAVRRDTLTITRHLALLDNTDPDLAAIYRLLTSSIQHYSKQHDHE